MTTDPTCPNGCDLATFGTHAGPPDCDLDPADPGARLVNARLRAGGPVVEVALASRDDLPATYVPRRLDDKARRAYVDEPAPESLAAARVGLEHVEHHGQGLRFVGSTLTGDLTEHRFACMDRTCPFVLAWSVLS